MKILFTLILWHFWIPFDKTSYQQNGERIRTSLNIVISKILLKFDEIPIADYLPIAQPYYFYRYSPYITAFLVVSKHVVYSRNLKKLLPYDKFTVPVVLKLRIFYRYHSRISVISAHLPWMRYLRFIGTLIHILDKVSSVESSEVQPCDTVRKPLQIYLLKTFLP